MYLVVSSVSSMRSMWVKMTILRKPIRFDLISGMSIVSSPTSTTSSVMPSSSSGSGAGFRGEDDAACGAGLLGAASGCELLPVDAAASRGR